MNTAGVQRGDQTGKVARPGLVLLNLVSVCLATCVLLSLSPPASAQYPVIDHWEFERIPLPPEYARLARDTNPTMSLAIDSEDRAHMILGEANALYAYRDDSGWSVQALGRREAPTLRLDAEGRPHLVYYEGSRLHYEVLTNGEWIERHSFAASGRANGLALDTAGHPHIAYLKSDSADGSTIGPAYTWWDGTVWHDTLVAAQFARNVGLAVDGSGSATIVFDEQGSFDDDGWSAYGFKLWAAVPGPEQIWQYYLVDWCYGPDVWCELDSDSLQVPSDSDGNTLVSSSSASMLLIKPSPWQYSTGLVWVSPDGSIIGGSGWHLGEECCQQAMHAPGLSGTAFFIVNEPGGLRFRDVEVRESGNTGLYLPDMRAADVAVGPDGQPRMVVYGPDGALYGRRYEVELTNQAFLPVAISQWFGNWSATDPLGVTRLVTSGPDPVGDIVSYPIVSNNGRWVAFENSSETFNAPGVVIKDRATGQSKCISVDHEGNCRIHAYWHSMSADGRLVVFRSEASLLPEDTNDAADIYLYDNSLDELELISQVPDLAVTQYWVERGVAISGDGRTIACVTDREQGHGIAVLDRETGQIDNLLLDPATDPLAERPSYLSLSDDGRYVAFTLSADLLLIGDSNGHADVFVYDRQTEIVELVSVRTDGGQADGPSLEPRISGNGRYVIFTTEAGNLSAGDNNSATDIYRHDRTTGETFWISRNMSSTGADSYAPDISSDGQLMVFESYANFGNAADDNGYNDVYLVDGEDEPELLSATPSGVAGNKGSATPALSPNGVFVVFKSEARDLVDVETFGRTNLFIRRVR